MLKWIACITMMSLLVCTAQAQLVPALSAEMLFDTGAWVGYGGVGVNVGGTNFGVEYWESEDISAQGRKLDTLSLIAVQELSSIGSEMSLSYHRSGFSDNTANNYNDIDIVYFQTKLNF